VTLALQVYLLYIYILSFRKSVYAKELTSEAENKIKQTGIIHTGDTAGRLILQVTLHLNKTANGSQSQAGWTNQ